MKNKVYNVQENKLIVGDTVLTFDLPIKQCVELNEMLIVRLDALGKAQYNENVFGVDLLEEKIKWKIEKRRYRTDTKQGCPFVDITISENKLRLNNWCDAFLIVDPTTGKILESGEAR
jgi:hypothetical protein